MRSLLLALLATVMISPASAQSTAESNKPTSAKADTASDPDKAIRCRKVEVTGSMVKKGRVCKTLAEWRNINDNHNDLARRMVEDGTTRPSGQ